MNRSAGWAGRTGAARSIGGGRSGCAAGAAHRAAAEARQDDQSAQRVRPAPARARLIRAAAQTLEALGSGHDPEKLALGLGPGWIPAFGKDHAPPIVDRAVVSVRGAQLRIDAGNVVLEIGHE